MRKRSRTVKLTLMGSALFLAGCREEVPPAPLPVAEENPGGDWTGSEEMASYAAEPVDPNAPATNVASNTSHSSSTYRSRTSHSFFPFFFWGGSGSGSRSYSTPPPASSGYRTVQTPSSTGSKPSGFSGSTSHTSTGSSATHSSSSGSSSRGGFGSTGRASSSAS